MTPDPASDQSAPGAEPSGPEPVPGTPPVQSTETTLPLGSAELLSELLDDARRVAVYGQRSGRLADNNLVLAIAALEKVGLDTPWDHPAIITLQTALNRAVAAMYPTTLADLRNDDWKPFHHQHHYTRGNFAFVIFSLLLMGFTAYWTVQYNRGAEIIRSVEQLQNDEPRAAIGSIVRQLMRSKVPTGAELPEEPFFVLVDQLHTYQARFDDLVPDMRTFLQENTLVHDHIRNAWTGVVAYFGQLQLVRSATAAATPPGATTPSLEALPEYQPCAIPGNSPQLVANVKYVPSSDTGKALSVYVHNTLDVLCAEGIRFTPASLPAYVPFLEGMRHWSNALGLWYLPALYGILGATLFYMRRVLDPTVPDPPFIRVLHRLALGAFAGVIVTWFWAPNSELAAGFTSIGLTLLTIAFLIGFSVDVLFALLDRLVTVLMNIARGGPPPSGPIAVPAVVLQTNVPATPPTANDQKTDQTVVTNPGTPAPGGAT